MKLYVTWGSRELQDKIESATVSEEAGALSRISQALSQATEFWRSWALAIGGEIVNINGASGTIKVPADMLEELPTIHEKFAGRIGVAVAVGVGSKPSEASRAMQAAQLRGDDHIMLYGPEVDDILSEANEPPKDAVDVLAEEHLKHELPFLDREVRALAKAFPVKNTIPNSQAGFSVPFGPIGLRAADAYQAYTSHLHLQKNHPDLFDKSTFVTALRKDAKFYADCANVCWKEMRKSYQGDLAKTAYAWRWGTKALDIADPELVYGDGEVLAFLRANEDLIKTEEPQIAPLRKGSFSPAGPDILTAPSPSAPAMNAGAGRAGMSGPRKPAAPAKPRGEASEHSEGEAARAMMENSNPGVETTTTAKDYEDQLTSMAEDSGEDKDERDGNSLKAESGNDAIRARVVQILTQIRQQAPYLEQLKKLDPDLYQVFMDTIQTMLAMAQQLMEDETPKDADEKKGETLAENEDDESEDEGSKSASDDTDTKKDEMKAELPMPHAAAHHNLNLPVGSYKEGDGKIKVQHQDNGKEGWVEARAGQVLSHDGHAISALNPNGR